MFLLIPRRVCFLLAADWRRASQRRPHRTELPEFFVSRHPVEEAVFVPFSVDGVAVVVQPIGDQQAADLNDAVVDGDLVEGLLAKATSGSLHSAISTARVAQIGDEILHQLVTYPLLGRRTYLRRRGSRISRWPSISRRSKVYSEGKLRRRMVISARVSFAPARRSAP